MRSRREFIKSTMLLSGVAGLSGIIPPSIQRALAINPAPGSTYLDAEHVVILMQENRSFDHCFGSLQGVRGFNDPRAFRLANGNPVWYQTNKAGKTFAPFRLNIRDTKATWMGSLPHSRASQTDAYHKGLHDEWLNACAHRNEKYASMPLTMGYHNRNDLPFNYAMADAFTICDQNFCSALTSTWPNRHYLWTGTIRNEQHPASRARIRNDLAFGEALWRTFPERLEDNDISWRIYQNDLTCGGGYEADERSWLTNFTCNPLEYYKQFNVKFSDRYVKSLQQQVETLPTEIREIEQKLNGSVTGSKDLEKLNKDLVNKRNALISANEELSIWTEANFSRLSPREKNLYEKAFTTNKEDPDYRLITEMQFMDGNTERSMTLPKGDILHRFRADVREGKLPAVSWIVPPARFSDHPSSPWYGAWYVSEVLDILTQNPEVWKKTIFILTYDENDGYFDHIPPFVSPDPTRENAGKVSAGIDPAIEYIPLEQELSFGISAKDARGGQIGLGYRVPMIIASPWSRGGRVNSQVFDHTSSLQFLEKFLSRKSGKEIREDNISAWRRTVCGDLTSVFAAYQPDKMDADHFLKKEPFVESIYNAQFRQDPDAFREILPAEIAKGKMSRPEEWTLPEQEKGVRPSCALPYELFADSNPGSGGKTVELVLKAGRDLFGARAAGAPFAVYTPVAYREEGREGGYQTMQNRQYAVAPGDELSDSWDMEAFQHGSYHLRVYGPNGFFREFTGSRQDPPLSVYCHYEYAQGQPAALSGNVLLSVYNNDPEKRIVLELTDESMGKPVTREQEILPGSHLDLPVNLKQSFGWYVVSLRAKGYPAFLKQYAGRVETGKESYTDPVMGRVV